MSISPKGNAYDSLGGAGVASLKKDGLNGVLSGGYESTLASQSSTYADAQYRLAREFQDLLANARGTNWDGVSEAGTDLQKKAQALIDSWDPVAGTFAGYDPKLSAQKFALEAKQSGLTGEGETARARAAGLGTRGGVIPGSSPATASASPSFTREEVFLKAFPLATKAQFDEWMARPLTPQQEWAVKTGINPSGNPWDVNMINTDLFGKLAAAPTAQPALQSVAAPAATPGSASVAVPLPGTAGGAAVRAQASPVVGTTAAPLPGATGTVTVAPVADWEKNLKDPAGKQSLLAWVKMQLTSVLPVEKG